MITNNGILIGKTAEGEEAVLLPGRANRHGLIAGATGSGKTISLKVMAEGFSSLGVPTFISDVKGDISGMAAIGTAGDKLNERLAGLSITDFSYTAFPVTFWDIYGKTGIPLRTTISEMGPLLLGRILNLTNVQADILTVLFKIADDEQLLLIDTKDLKSMIAYVSENNKKYETSYGKMSTQSLSAITRAVVALEAEGGDIFFGETALSVTDWMSVDMSGRGMMHILNASSLINSPKLYATFLLWMLSELFEILPEVGDLDKPKMVFFFDEAHLLFADAPKELLSKIEQVVKLIRSKGVGVYFCTQNPSDIPGGVLAQLSHKIQHNLQAYSPAEQKGVKTAAQAFPANPDMNTYDTILTLGTGEAVVSFLDEKGVPTPAKKITVLPPQSSMNAIDAATMDHAVKASLLYAKYATPVDNFSAYEFLLRRGEEEAKAKEEALLAEEQAKTVAKEEAAAAKAAAKEEAAAAKAAEREAQKEAAARKRAVKSVGNSVAGSVGREVGKTVGSTFGQFGKTLGGNVGASIGRGLLSTILKL